MKVLYAVQGTGNGHIARAKDVIPALRNRVQLDVVVSGVQSDLELPFCIKQKYHGLSFIFGKSGGINLFKTIKQLHVFRFIKDVWNCPVREYDLVVNDFEPVTAWACKLRGVRSIALSHQSALISKAVPRPKENDLIGRIVLKYYAPCYDRFSFHFSSYEDRIFTPVIRSEIRKLKKEQKDHYTVYLPSYGDKKLIEVLSKVQGVRWHVFSKHSSTAYEFENVFIRPVDGERFNQSMASARGVLCGAGFETPAEALYLKKKLLVIPMKGQYEQQCNAAALEEMGVPVIKKMSVSQIQRIQNWVDSEKVIKVDYQDKIQNIIDELLVIYIASSASDPENLASIFSKVFKKKMVDVK